MSNQIIRTVYLAGPISGLNYGESTGWREEMAKVLPPWLKTYSPMRGKEHLSAAGKIEGAPVGSLLTTRRGITVRDRYDVHRCDAILINLLGAKKVSIGTMFEFAWAETRRIPIIVVIENSGNMHDHPFVHEYASFVTDNLDVARQTLIDVLRCEYENPVL